MPRVRSNSLDVVLAGEFSQSRTYSSFSFQHGGAGSFMDYVVECENLCQGSSVSTLRRIGLTGRERVLLSGAQFRLL